MSLVLARPNTALEEMANRWWPTPPGERACPCVSSCRCSTRRSQRGRHQTRTATKPIAHSTRPKRNPRSMHPSETKRNRFSLVQGKKQGRFELELAAGASLRRFRLRWSFGGQAAVWARNEVWPVFRGAGKKAGKNRKIGSAGRNAIGRSSCCADVTWPATPQFLRNARARRKPTTRPTTAPIRAM